ncbi:DUF5641 domain-containing protein [Trichonephila clavipes]|nr:DUF5641 domain-containing protein [Trichonephila clavipes]
MAYVLRFCNNLKKNRIDPKKGKLEVAELYEAEKLFLKEIQLETLAEEKQIKLNTMKGDDGLIRVETRVSCRKDLETFRYPILLPNTHQLVKKLIMEKHIELKHAGTQTLMSNLRESYWIIKVEKRFVRPITYLSEDPKDLVALTPAMFLQEIREIGVPDFDMIDSKKLERRFIYRVKIRKDLRNRFRNEYLGLLKDYSKVRKEASVKDGDIVLIGDNDVKRINWPMAKIIKSFPGKMVEFA